MSRKHRWAQVTEELRQALWELEEEKEKRRHVEEEMNLKAHEQDNLKNKLSALMEERENKNAVMLVGEEAERCLLVPAFSPSEEGDQLVGGPKYEKEAALASPRKQHEPSLQEMKRDSESTKRSPELGGVNQLQTLQVYQVNEI